MHRQHAYPYRKSAGVYKNTTRTNKQGCRIQYKYTKISRISINQQQAIRNWTFKNTITFWRWLHNNVNVLNTTELYP